jgi:hypothetical protein
LSGFE